MSQTMTSPTVSKAFLRVPSNPNVRARTDEMQEAEPQQQLHPQPAPQQPVVQQPAPQQPPVAPAAPAAPAAPMQTPPYVAPVPRPEIDPMLVRQLEEERRRLAEESAQKDEAIRNLLAEKNQLQQVKTERELEKVLDSLSFDDLGSVDPEDAKRIAKSVLGITKQNLVGQVEERLNAQQQALQATYAQQQHELLRRDVEARNRDIMRVHPDFFALQETPQYREFMSQPITPGSTLTRDAVAAKEYQQGNTAFVIELLNQMKQSSHSPESIMTVAPVQSATSMNAASTDDNTSPAYTLRELNDMYQMRVISQEEYREQLAKLRNSGNA